MPLEAEEGDDGGDLAVSVDEMVLAELVRARVPAGMMRDVGRTGRFKLVPLREVGDNSLSDMSLAVAVCGETVAMELEAGESDWNASVSVGTICAPVCTGNVDLGGIGKCIFGGSIGLTDRAGLGAVMCLSLLFVLLSGVDIASSCLLLVCVPKPNFLATP